MDSNVISSWSFGRGHGEADNRDRVAKVLAAALKAVDPRQAVLNCISLDGDTFQVADRSYDLGRYRKIYVIGGGKASVAMAQAVEEVLGSRITDGLVNTKYGYMAPLERIRINEAGHPVPDDNGMQGGRQMLDMARNADADSLVICLISGGGSALLVSPVEGITLADKQALTQELLRCGATINEINSLRKHLSEMKGGNLARIASPAPIISLILSDVVGNPLDVIASGPTVPDTSSFSDALDVLRRYGIIERIPGVVLRHLERGAAGEIDDTPKEGDEIFDGVQNVLVASNEIAAAAAEATARSLGFNTLFLTNFIEGEAREVAKVFAAMAREIDRSGKPLARPACVIAGGETTVTLHGKGKGGRNQEFSLAAALKIEGLRNVVMVSLATDGSDGPTDASGALVDGVTIRRARQLGLDPYRYLADNDSFHFFEQTGDLLLTGPTNTNVNDLLFVFAL